MIPSSCQWEEKDSHSNPLASVLSDLVLTASFSNPRCRKRLHQLHAPEADGGRGGDRKRFVLVAAPSLAPAGELGSLHELGSWLSHRPWVGYSLELPITRRFWLTHLGRPFSSGLRLVAPDLRAEQRLLDRTADPSSAASGFTHELEADVPQIVTAMHVAGIGEGEALCSVAHADFFHDHVRAIAGSGDEEPGVKGPQLIAVAVPTDAGVRDELGDLAGDF
jgi:hypothetical protein